MRISRTLSLYVLREAVQYAAIGLLAVGSVLLTQNLLQRLDDLAAIGAGGGDVLAVVGCLVVMLATYTVPVAILFGVLVAVGRLSSDSEIMVMRALGVSLAQLVTPFLILGLLVSGTTAYLLAEAEPAARQRLRAVMASIASRGGIIQEREFNRLDRRGDRLLFVDERGENNELVGVMISDRTNPDQPFTVVAEGGRFDFDDASATAFLDLERGDIHFEPDIGASGYQHIAFDTFRYAFDMSAVLGSGFNRLRPPEMRLSEVREILDYFEVHGEPPPVIRDRKRWRYEIQLHRRTALPFAPLLFCLVGVPLGLRRTKGARSLGVLVCVALAFGYYALLATGVYLAENQLVEARLALWIPNVAFALMAVILLLRARRAES